MRVLLVKLKNIGDSLIMTPTISAIRSAYPDSEIHVLVRKGCEGILAGCDAIDFIYTSAKVGEKKHVFASFIDDLKLIYRFRRLNFDYAFELGHGDRGRTIAGLSKAKNRCVNVYARPLKFFWRPLFNRQASVNWNGLHQVEMDYCAVNAFLNLPSEIPPLCFKKHRAVVCDFAKNLTDFVVVHPTARWKRKVISADKWIEVCKWILQRVDRIILSTGPAKEEIEYGRRIKDVVGDRVIMTEGKTSWSQLAWLLYRARLFVGVDTAAMHLAAACACPVVAVFGPTSVNEWRPWKVKHEIVLPEKEDFDRMPPETVINSITPDKIIKACERMIS
jgi:heptosyltransferase-3